MLRATLNSILFICLVCILINCTKKKQEKESSIKTSEKPKSEFITLSDSVNNTWNFMIGEDDRKLLLVKRLIEEISYTPQPDPSKIEKVKLVLEKVKARRYTQFNLAEGDNIDFYDRSTDTLLRSVYQLAAVTPNIDRYPLVNELISDVSQLDNQVVIQRARYDHWAKNYNAYLESKKEEISTIYPDCTNIKTLGLFELQE